MGPSTSDPTAAFLAHLAEYGLDPGTIKWDRKIHRFPGMGKGKRNEAAFYRAFEDQRGATFGDYSQGIVEPVTWQYRNGGKPDDLGPQEWANRKRQWKEAAEEREAERIRDQAAAAVACNERWKAASTTVDLDHPYLQAKRIESAPGLRQEGDLLLVPMKAFVDGNPLVNIQTIDGDGEKRFSFGAQVVGTRTTIGARAFLKDPKKVLYLCEGWATGWAVHHASKKAVVVAFNAGNLEAVATSLREEYPGANIIICADNDRWTAVRRDGQDVPNPGVDFAERAARIVGAEVAVPDFARLDTRPTDFHDLHLLEGADAVVSWLDPRRAQEADCTAGEVRDGAVDGGEGSSVTEPGVVTPWPVEPNIPGRSMPQPQPLPIDALPTALRDHVESVSEALQVPHDMSIALALGMISAVLAGRVEVQPRKGWTQPVGLYVGVILPPASRKSPAFSHMIAPLRGLEAGDVDRIKPSLLAAQDKVSVAERKLDRLMTDVVRDKPKSKPDDVKKARLELEEARARVPPDGRLLAGDITPEAMVLRMAEQGGRLAILEPEPGPLQLLAGRYSNGGPRLDEIKKAWSGEAFIVDRVNRPTVHVPRPALTLALCVQPEVLGGLDQGKAFRYEGVLGRFLWVQPPHGLGSRRTGADVPVIDALAERKYAATVERLWGLQPRTPDGSDDVHVLGLSSGALTVLHEYEGEVEAQLADGARLESIRDWAGKCVGQALRVAALLELARRAEAGEPLVEESVSASAMEAAVRLMRAFTTHALVVLGSTDKKTALLTYVLRRATELVEWEDGEVTVRDLWQACRGKSGIDSVKDLNGYVAELTALGCMRLTTVPTCGPGRPGSPRLELHPALGRAVPEIPKTSHTAKSDLASGDNGDGFVTAAPPSASDEGDPLQLLEDVLR